MERGICLVIEFEVQEQLLDLHLILSWVASCTAVEEIVKLYPGLRYGMEMGMGMGMGMGMLGKKK
jgi:hypothetical protein